jgi:hypothetical protein
MSDDPQFLKTASSKFAKHAKLASSAAAKSSRSCVDPLFPLVSDMIYLKHLISHWLSYSRVSSLM